MTASFEYSNTVEMQESNPKSNFMTIIEVLQEELIKTLKEI